MKRSFSKLASFVFPICIFFQNKAPTFFAFISTICTDCMPNSIFFAQQFNLPGILLVHKAFICDFPLCLMNYHFLQVSY